MEKLIKLTKDDGPCVLIGTDSIIKIERVSTSKVTTTKVQSRGAMIETTYVRESVEDIYKLYKGK